MSYRKKHYPPKQDKPDQQSMFTPEYDNPGVLRSLPTSRLTSGLAYQRPVNERVVNRLIRDWDEQLLEPLIVSFRDGRFHLVDGQHRVIALRRKNDGRDVMVLCRVYSGLTYEQEAELCFKLEGEEASEHGAVRQRPAGSGHRPDDQANQPAFEV